jgi:hypothetical protein
MRSGGEEPQGHGHQCGGEYGDRMTVDDAPTVKVGVRLDADPDGLGELLADAAAFDAAGADALWVDVDPGSGLDVAAVLAALAAVTARSQLILPLGRSAAPTEESAGRLDTVRRLSRDRLGLVIDAEADDDIPARLGGVPMLRLSSAVATPGLIEGRDDAGEVVRWVTATVPTGRAAWREAMVEAGAREAYGLLVPAAPALLDLLRNPDDPGGRSDLRIAQG